VITQENNFNAVADGVRVDKPGDESYQTCLISVCWWVCYCFDAPRHFNLFCAFNSKKRIIRKKKKKPKLDILKNSLLSPLCWNIMVDYVNDIK